MEVPGVPDCGYVRCAGWLALGWQLGLALGWQLGLALGWQLWGWQLGLALACGLPP
jgi:hypothetical protein